MTTAGGPLRPALTLAEMVVSMVLVSVMLVAALNVAGGVRQGENDSALRRRAQILAEDLMSEILEQDYADPTEDPNVLGMSATEASTGDRSLFNDVDDYDGWKARPPQLKSGVTMTGLDNWQRSVNVVWVKPNKPSRTSSVDLGAKRITIKVKYGSTLILRLKAVRTAGLPPLGTCCLPDLGCEMLRTETCAALGGIFGGEGSSCYTHDCEICDDFESYTAGSAPASWIAGGGAAIEVRDDGGNLVLWDGTGEGGPVIYTAIDAGDIELRQSFRSLSGTINDAGLIARYVDDSNMVYGGIVQSRRAQIWVCRSGTWDNIGDGYDTVDDDGAGAWNIPNVASGWHSQELRIVGSSVELYIDGSRIGTATLPAGSPASGYTGFWSQDKGQEGYRDDHCARLPQ